MIKTQYLVPGVYYDKSRDFQLLGRLFDVIFNDIKTNSNLIYNNPLSKNMDKDYLELAALTLGLKLKHNYNLEQLYYVLSTFSEALRKKGSFESIELILNALLKLQNIEESAKLEFDQNSFVLNIYVPVDLKDNQLFNDLMDYLVPAGVCYNIFINTDIGFDSFTNMSINNVVTFNNYLAKDTSYIPTYDEINNPSAPDTGNSNLKGGGRNDNSVVVPYTDPNNEGE